MTAAIVRVLSLFHPGLPEALILEIESDHSPMRLDVGEAVTFAASNEKRAAQTYGLANVLRALANDLDAMANVWAASEIEAEESDDDE